LQSINYATKRDKIKQKPNIFLLSIFLLTFLIPITFTTLTTTIEVKPLSSETLAFNKTYGKIVQASMSIHHDYEKSIDFWVTNPKGDIILNLGRVSENPTRFKFYASQDGIYTLHFDNSFSSQNTKKIDLLYEIIPDPLPLTPIIFSGIIVGLILPAFIKHFLDFGWVKTIAISLVAVAITMMVVAQAVYNPVI
jgi:hypothetical protein